MKRSYKLKSLRAYFSCFIILIITSCTSLSPYKVPVLQGNIFEEDDEFYLTHDKKRVTIEIRNKILEDK